MKIINARTARRLTQSFLARSSTSCTRQAIGKLLALTFSVSAFIGTTSVFGAERYAYAPAKWYGGYLERTGPGADTAVEACLSTPIPPHALGRAPPYMNPGAAESTGQMSGVCAFFYDLGNGTIAISSNGFPIATNCQVPMGLSGGVCQANMVEKYIELHNNVCRGNPVYPASGIKRERVHLIPQRGLLGLGVGYSTALKTPLADGIDLIKDYSVNGMPSFSRLWASSLHKSLEWQVRGWQANRGNGDWVSIEYAYDSVNGYRTLLSSRKQDRFLSAGGGYHYFDVSAGAIEIYNSSGELTEIRSLAGEVATYTYDARKLLMSVRDQNGRSIEFRYEGAPGDYRISSVFDVQGSELKFQYEAGNLARVIWPDGSSRQFMYERPQLNWALTGVVDENGRRFSTFDYDDKGRATGTRHANDTQRFAITWATPPVREVTDIHDTVSQIILRVHQTSPPQDIQVTHPTGQTEQLSVTARSVSSSQPAGSGCSAASSQTVYDANDNLESRDDFNATRVCYSSDPTRNLEVTRIEGLATTTTCSTVTAVNASLPAGSRKTSTQWHPQWKFQTRVAEAGRLTTRIYNGQPDPFNSGAAASCAPTNALLPDGSPVAVLCKQVEQATTDVNGAQGFAAPLQTGVLNRQTTWTYNRWGQVLTEDGPRTDVTDTTTSTYYTDSSFTGEGAAASGHFMGDLATVTNAAGRVIQYTHYNKHGQVLRSIDPNGVVTQNTYDLRQRLLSATVGAQTTHYAYDPVGQLKRLTLPDLNYVGYDYDDAHRLVAVYDHKGNRTDYTLDNAGNRTGENTKDTSGALKRQLIRSIDALGRVQQTTGRE